MWVINQPPDTLCHYGKKGMKWGIVHEEKTSGSLVKKVKDSYENKKTSNEETRIKKYEALGYTKEQSKILSDGERKTKKVLAITGGIVLTAAVAYGAYKYRDYAKDSLVKANQTMQTVHKEDVAERLKNGNPFYATFDKKDNTIYASKVFSHFTDDSQITKFYTEDGIKIASHKSGKQAFQQLIKENNDFKDYVGDTLGLHRGLIDKKDPISQDKLYKAFNHKLVYRTGGADGIDHDKFHNMFYSTLKAKGYGGVIDTNDSIVEGFTYKPTIVFSDAKKNVISSMKATEEELGAARMAKGLAYSSTRKILNNPFNSPTVQQASVIGASSSVAYLVNINKITDYKVKHPKTKLSDKEILKIIK